MADNISRKAKKEVLPIYMYTDYRKYLKDKYDELKNTTPYFSYRYFSKRAGFASPNFLKLVIDRKRNLSLESIHRFAEAFKLAQKEERFFELLVQYDQSSDPHQRQHYYQLLLEFPEYRKVHHLEKEEYDYLSHWYYPAILELVSLPSFQEELDWIVKAFKEKITIKEAKQAIDDLLKIGLLERSAEGKIITKHRALTTGEEAKSLAAYHFHEEILDQAKLAVREQNPKEREYAAITMTLNEEQLQKMKQMIRDFRKMVLNYLSEAKENPEAVYQLSMQLFSLTKGINKNNGG